MKICSFCVMDETDPGILFDHAGRCNRCRDAEDLGKKIWFPTDYGKHLLDEIVESVIDQGRGSEYDCLIGLSGGIDSAYLAYRLRTDYPSLRILAVHVDGGWNSEIAVKNIELLVKALEIDLHTEVIDWLEMRDLQLSFMKASVKNQDIPQDHAFFASIYHLAAKHRIRTFFSGGNFATECILPPEWGHSALDAKHLRAIHRRYGKMPKLSRYPTVSFWQLYFWYPVIKQFRVVRPLNLMRYSRSDAKILLKNALGWSDYGGKHHESRFTKFFQTFYLPSKFSIDKRKAHLSSMIVSGQMTRDIALSILSTSPYDMNQLHDDIFFISKKIGVSVLEFEKLLAVRPADHGDFPTSKLFYRFKDVVKKLVQLKAK